MKKLALVCSLMLAAAPAAAQVGFPYSLNSQPTAGSLDLQYCLVGSHACVWRHAIAYGDVCDQWLADDMGYERSGDIEGFIPPGFHYASWRCRVFSSGKVFSGKAGK